MTTITARSENVNIGDVLICRDGGAFQIVAIDRDEDELTLRDIADDAVTTRATVDVMTCIGSWLENYGNDDDLEVCPHCGQEMP